MVIEYILLSWILTIIIEAVIIWLVLKPGFLKTIAYSTIINSISLPLAVYSYQYVINNIIIVEAIVIFVEGFLIKALFQVEYKKAFFLSILVNIVTAIIGLFLPPIH
jgi:hypothetical protein